MAEPPRPPSLVPAGHAVAQVVEAVRAATGKRWKETGCPVCGGSGWVVERRGAGPVALQCGCVAIDRDRGLFAGAGIPPRYQACFLDSFQAATASQHHALASCQAFVAGFPAVDGGLLLLGPVGAGKTHLAVGVLIHLLRRGVDGQFFNCRELLQRITGRLQRLDAGDHYARALDCGVLLLDELGGQRISEWNHDVFMTILEHRYETQRLTLATASYPDQLPDTDDEAWRLRGTVTEVLTDRIGLRARSILRHMCTTVEVIGDDGRVNREPYLE